MSRTASPQKNKKSKCISIYFIHSYIVQHFGSTFDVFKCALKNKLDLTWNILHNMYQVFKSQPCVADRPKLNLFAKNFPSTRALIYCNNHVLLSFVFPCLCCLRSRAFLVANLVTHLFHVLLIIFSVYINLLFSQFFVRRRLCLMCSCLVTLHVYVKSIVSHSSCVWLFFEFSYTSLRDIYTLVPFI